MPFDEFSKIVEHLLEISKLSSTNSYTFKDLQYAEVDQRSWKMWFLGLCGEINYVCDILWQQYSKLNDDMFANCKQIY